MTSYGYVNSTIKNIKENSADMKGHKFEVLDSFRGICAICVVFFHMRIYSSFTEIPFFRNSDYFVEFFFILSGFVLAYSYINRKSLDIKDFFIARTFRILPLHWFMLLVFVCLEIAKLTAYKHGISFSDAPFTGEKSLSEIIPNVLLLQSWTNLTEKGSFNFPSWSISIEYYTYFIFFLTLTFKGVLRNMILLLIISLCLIFKSGLWIITQEALRGLSCFFIGVITYLIQSRIKNIKINSTLCSFAELIMLIACVSAVSSEFFGKLTFTILIFMVTVLIFSFERGVFSLILKHSLFRLIGSLSYSIYLTHTAVLFVLFSILAIYEKKSGHVILVMIDGKRMINADGWLAGDLAAILIAASVIGISLITYKLIEMPAQRVGKSIRARSTSRMAT